jgi:hypothetical protein
LLSRDPVATLGLKAEALCHDWDALKRAAQKGDLAYEYDGYEVHVWPGRPEHGDLCRCGTREWA